MLNAVGPGGAMRPAPPDETVIHILWINAGLSCDGDSVALTAATQPSIEEIALAGFNPNSAGACACEGVDVPELLKVGLKRPCKCFEIALDDRELKFRVLGAKLVIDGHSNR